jgi:hypothetical protein
MSTNDPLRAALEHYRQRRSGILEELRKIELTIRQLESDTGEGSDDRAENYSPIPADSLAEKTFVSSGKGVPSVRHDEFFGMTQSEAAKAYLTKVGHAVSMDQLVEALQSGGCKVGGVSAKRTLYISLVRNIRDFVPVSSGVIGLRAFYPGLKSTVSTSAKNVSKRKKAKASGKRKAKKLLAKKKAQPQKSAPTETLAHKTVYSLLADRASHSKESVLKAGKDAGVLPIAIHGILRNAKDIETTGDQIRLKNGAGGNGEKVRTG